MSRRDSTRDSDSRRHRPRFDREPSPKRSRRDDKGDKDRVPEKSNLDSTKHADREVEDQKQRRKLQDALPLESSLVSDSKVESGAPVKDSDSQPSGRTKNSSHHPDVPRSRSYHQHDERGSAGQAVRSSGRSSNSEHGRLRDSKDQHDDKTATKTATNGSRLRHDKAKDNDNRTWRHDGYFEMEADLPAGRKRPAFREKKIPVESENTGKTAAENAKSSHPDPSSEGGRKKVERGDIPRHLDRSEKQFAGDRARYRGEAQRGVFSSRERYTDGAGRNYRGRDRFDSRQGYQSSSGRVEKWKHDLYHEANRSPTKNEEDQIAKVESLLAS